MSKDYYKTLGVRKNASTKTIRNAYRKLAREKHPDSGGSSEEFIEIKEAYDVLSDPDRRAHYDRTGEDKGRPLAIDDGRMQRIIMTLAHHLQMAIDRTYSPTTTDLLAAMKQSMVGTRASQQSEKKHREQLKEKLQDISERFSVEEGENYLQCMMTSNCRNLEAQIADHEDRISILDESIKILSKFKYRRDDSPWRRP